MNDTPRDDTTLPPQPEPTAEPAPEAPGGADAVIYEDHSASTGSESGGRSGVVGHDPLPDRNPATDDDALPSETKEGEDTSTRASRGGTEVPPEEESPA